METANSTSLSDMGVGQIIPAVKVLLEAIVHRGELAAVELTEVSDHASRTVLFAMASVALVLLAGFAATFMLAAAVWDSPERTLVLGLVALGYLLGAAVLAGLAIFRLKAWRPFQETRRQLRRDHECVQTVLTPTVTNTNGHAHR